MATVFNHVHFCPECLKAWICVRWQCPNEDDGELQCLSCREAAAVTPPRAAVEPGTAVHFAADTAPEHLPQSGKAVCFL
jgi:hypothetical protein